MGKRKERRENSFKLIHADSHDINVKSPLSAYFRMISAKGPNWMNDHHELHNLTARLYNNRSKIDPDVLLKRLDMVRVKVNKL